ncbi:MAG: DUF362 domain-containing protein [Candidatus Methanofastidiosia archaeon]|jgi:uncharacterized protein (DUF362 family)
MGSVLVIDAEYDTMDQVVKKIFDHFDPPKNDVLIKPNLLGGYPPENHVTTHPSVIDALVTYFEGINKNISVGDNPAGSTNLIQKAQKAGLFQAAHGYFTDISTGVNIPVESDHFSQLVVSKPVLDASYILNVPKFKTHLQTIITGAIKNMFGILPGEEKSLIHAKFRTLQKFSEALVDIYSVRPPDLTIMDAVIGMEGNGPSSGAPKHIGKVLASDNGVELDAVMAHMMGLNPYDVPMLEYAHTKKLGEISFDRIEIMGDVPVIPFKVPSKTVVSFITPISSRYYDFLAIKPYLKKEKCIKCYECVKKCPVSALKCNEYPYIDRDKCVSCFCCVEICEHHAMQVPSRARDIFNRFILRV